MLATFVLTLLSPLLTAQVAPAAPSPGSREELLEMLAQSRKRVESSRQQKALGPESASLELESLDRQQRNAMGLKETKMVGPDVVKANWDQFRYQVGLVYSGAPTRAFCGGALIGPDVVITAAHCLQTKGPGPNVTMQPRDVQLYHGDSRLPGAGHSYAVASFLVPSSFSLATLDYDVAVIKLAERVGGDLGGLTLATAASAPLHSGTNVLVSGWGDRIAGAGIGSADLYFGLLPLIGYSKCNASYPGEITARMFCAGNENDSCQGDSGGPVVMPVGGKPQLVGVVSWGSGCGVKPGVYTNLTGEAGDWLQQALQ